MILKEALLLTAIGLAVGLVLAVLTGSAASTLLFGLQPHDPVSLVVAVGLLGPVAFAASYLPARAAAQIDPMAALRID
jgi:ABC-type antimicrobial peptide transport system permease subunit